MRTKPVRFASIVLPLRFCSDIDMQCLRVRCDVNIITQFELITEKQLNYKTRTKKKRKNETGNKIRKE